MIAQQSELTNNDQLLNQQIQANTIDEVQQLAPTLEDVEKLLQEFINAAIQLKQPEEESKKPLEIQSSKPDKLQEQSQKQQPTTIQKSEIQQSQPLQKGEIMQLCTQLLNQISIYQQLLQSNQDQIIQIIKQSNAQISNPQEKYQQLLNQIKVVFEFVQANQNALEKEQEWLTNLSIENLQNILTQLQEHKVEVFTILQLNTEDYQIISSINENQNNEQEIQNQIQLYQKQFMMLEQSCIQITNDMDCLHHKSIEQNDNFLKSQSEIQLSQYQTKLIYFCSTCFELCCQQCITKGPHNNKIHIIHFLSNYRNKMVQLLNQFLQTKLEKKKDVIIGQIAQINDRMNQIQYQVEIIQKDIQLQETGLLERLDLDHGSKISILQSDIAKLQRDLNDIDDFIITFEKCLELNDKLQFLGLYKQLKLMNEKLSTIIVNPSIGQYPYELPQEWGQIKSSLKQVQVNQNILYFKNEVIWELKTERDRSVTQIQNNIKEQNQKEFDKWIRMADEISQRFEGFNLVCYFCGQIMSQQTINAQCFINNQYKRDPKMISYTIQEPSKEDFGNKRHFFARPLEKYTLIQLGKLPELGDRIYSQILYYNMLKLQQFTFAKIKKTLYEKQINLKDEFTKLQDHSQEGYISIVKFQYILNEKLNLSDKEISRLTKFLQEGIDQKPNIYQEVILPLQNKDLINFNILLDILKDKDYLEKKSYDLVQPNRIDKYVNGPFITFDYDLYQKEQNKKQELEKLKQQQNSKQQGQLFGSKGQSSNESMDLNKTLKKSPNQPNYLQNSNYGQGYNINYNQNQNFQSTSGYEKYNYSYNYK